MLLCTSLSLALPVGSGGTEGDVYFRSRLHNQLRGRITSSGISEANHEGGRAAVQHQHAASTLHALHSGQTMIRYGQRLDGDLVVVQKSEVVQVARITRSVNSACWDRRP